MSSPDPPQIPHTTDQIVPSSWSPTYPTALESFSMSPNASTMYHAQTSPSHLHPSHVQKEDAWVHHAPTHASMDRAYDQHMPRLDIPGQIEPSWAPGVPAMNQQQVSSAPPGTGFPCIHYPEGRERDRIRSRSYHPMWSWGHESGHSLYQE
ncbi:uncharacterized protein LAESUDRAFT_724578 [Laetiporus sulphureus 93-53]|uniref:Uncharacterized protein n=1 Tax=Laetiporus sulphureus 93-53 TaxID=1314785 RepID=A0A165ERF4_9APHY|nr:uncharacterized protein LAESUDRAFT_724578 [Laetiporus sulphureus 93-53]KZT07610.1 hypothetical protein LAESUDRAFT_724578 [Laetiporus sulphureus 93-53]